MNIGQSDAVTIGEYNEQGELMRGYYYSPQNSLANAPVAIKHNDNGITQTSYYQNDHLNTPQMLTRPNGAIVWQGQYDAFGEVTQTNTQVSNPLRFPGQYQDDETGLHYNWHRYYDNNIGRYVTSDPIGLDGGLNTYGYAEQNSLLYTDPYGLYCLTDAQISAIASGIGGGVGGAITGAVVGAAAGGAVGGIVLGISGAIRGAGVGIATASVSSGFGSSAIGAATEISGAAGRGRSVIGGLVGDAVGDAVGGGAVVSGAVGGAIGGVVSGGGVGFIGGAVGGAVGGLAGGLLAAGNNCPDDCSGE